MYHVHNVQGDFFLMRDLYEQFLTETDRKKIMAEGCAKLFKGMVEAQLDLDGLDSGLSPFDLGPDMYLPPPPLPLGLPPPPALNSGLGMDDDLAYLMGPCSAMHFEPLICMAQVRCPIARFEAAKSLAQLSNSGTSTPPFHAPVAVRGRLTVCPVAVRSCCRRQPRHDEGGGCDPCAGGAAAQGGRPLGYVQAGQAGGSCRPLQPVGLPFLQGTPYALHNMAVARSHHRSHV